MTRGFFGNNYEFLFQSLPSYLVLPSISTPPASSSSDSGFDLVAAYLSTARLCQENCDYTGGLSAIRAAVKTRPHNRNTQRHLTVALLTMCEWEAAIDSCDVEIVLSPREPSPRLLAAYLLAHLGQYGRAKVYVERGLRTATQDGQIDLRTDFFVLGKRLGMDEQHLLESIRYLTISGAHNEFAAQLNNATERDRHPDIFTAVQEIFDYETIGERKILSFGCSVGEEPYILATKYFKGARIVAVDVSTTVLNIAIKERSIPGAIHYDFSSPEIIKRHGPYDIIFALSVLCRWPDLIDQSDANGIFPFSKYTEIVKVLHDNLRTGGLLVIYNSNYDFSDVDFIDEYEIVKTPAVKSNGYVKHFDKNGLAIANYSGTELIYRKL